ncbi:TIGR03943 family putative permease subunit [Paenibacillus sp. MMS18-CY102]|uniref:TIGR03943 family putative permease subunit n=1 Tax=Paenibacillus sp. MMS18-CY102 TaxID=2682849 RepID=UPI0013661280|nr:TIGR03943 family protein [Paenibacillus sp. MMS18-CY102]MWC29524.1 TIGR03943 family protein [Paenibacillus sp. MMS18-CY102]
MPTNHSVRSLMAHYLFRAALLGGYAFLIVFLNKTGELSLFVAPRTEQAVKLSALGLYAAAAYQAYSAFRIWRDSHQEDCGCDHGHGPSPSPLRNTLIYSLFLLPLLLGFLMPHEPLNSTLAAKKGMSFTGLQSAAPPASPPAPAQQEKPSLDQLFATDDYTKAYASFGKKLYQQPSITVDDSLFIETLTTLDLFQSNFIGKQVTLTGFVYRDQGMSNEQFAVSRFVMNCCSADALPYGIMVHSSNAAAYPNDSWVNFTGTVTTTSFQNNTILMLEAASITPIPTPADTYAYPNYDFDL